MKENKDLLDLCPEYFKTMDIVSALRSHYFNLTDFEILTIALKIRENQIKKENNKK